mmetsp:Transcript_26259/g.55202  ORF Transcript_26259/g.55202 Transcript_26259/m.55202 type:complete len:348 (-) Transcript_26259:557-1600(-)
MSSSGVTSRTACICICICIGICVRSTEYLKRFGYELCLFSVVGLYGCVSNIQSILNHIVPFFVSSLRLWIRIQGLPCGFECFAVAFVGKGLAQPVPKTVCCQKFLAPLDRFGGHVGHEGRGTKAAHDNIETTRITAAAAAAATIFSFLTYRCRCCCICICCGFCCCWYCCCGMCTSSTRRPQIIVHGQSHGSGVEFLLLLFYQEFIIHSIHTVVAFAIDIATAATNPRLLLLPQVFGGVDDRRKVRERRIIDIVSYEQIMTMTTLIVIALPPRVDVERVFSGGVRHGKRKVVLGVFPKHVRFVIKVDQIAGSYDPPGVVAVAVTTTLAIEDSITIINPFGALVSSWR